MGSIRCLLWKLLENVSGFNQDDGNTIEKGDLGRYLKGIMDKGQGTVAGKG